MVRDHFVEHNRNRLHYAKAGNGDRHMLIFHGFGQDVSVFDFFTRSLAPHYSFYIFDLYFHGKSTWAHGETPLSLSEWKATIDKFLMTHGIDKFSLAGFSLGGKFVLATLDAFPSRIEQVYLIAPDGIKTNVWYSLATYPFFLRKFFKSMILHPERFLNIAEFLVRKKWVDHGLIRFAEYQMNTEEKRKRVYYSWVVFRHLHVNTKKIADHLNRYSIRFVLIVGKYDNVIQPRNMKEFLKRVKNYKFEILDSGHSGLINQSLPYFTEKELKI